jgi:hypothetical protein
MTRRITLRTSHGSRDEAATLAAALTPDNTGSMETRVEGEQIVTEIERETTGGLHSTADDYVVNLTVAETVARTARRTTRHTQS